MTLPTRHLLAPAAIPIVAAPDNPPEVATLELIAAAEVEDAASIVSWACTVVVPPEDAPFLVDEAADVACAEKLDPGTVGFVCRILKSDSCQRTCMPNTKSLASVVATHLLYEDDAPVRQV